ncbi:glycosyltransferase family 2 protein [Desulfobulbus sp. AH-315-M07]|nr:glycosyltransferase family 2 protein [Desulfobulbus sp. AH-315-M07]
MLQEQKIIVIAPCLDEQVKIATVVDRLQDMTEKIVDEILVVDDGSTDGSVAEVKKRGATSIEMGSVVGVGAALRAGFDYAASKGYDIIVVMAGNNKDEPNEIPSLVRPIVDDDADFVQGSRFLSRANFGHMPAYRKVATRIHPLLFSAVTGKRVTESTNGFRAFRIGLLDDPNIKLEQEWLNAYELEPYLYYKAVTLGYRTMEVPCTKVYPPKKLGYTKMKPISGWWSILRPLLLLKTGLRS